MRSPTGFYHSFLIFADLVNIKWYIIFISLVTSEAEHFFHVYWPLMSPTNCLFTTCPFKFFLLGVSIFNLIHQSSLRIQDINLSVLYVKNVFFPVCYLSKFLTLFKVYLLRRA